MRDSSENWNGRDASGVSSQLVTLPIDKFRNLLGLGRSGAEKNVASSINRGSLVHSRVSYLVSNLQGVAAPNATVPLVATAGPISDVLLKDKSWLSSPYTGILKTAMWCSRGTVSITINMWTHRACCSGMAMAMC
jgi:hypothetical protein